MATYGTVRRQSATTTHAPPPVCDESNNYPRNSRNNGVRYFVCPFHIPKTSEAAAIRIMKNMAEFGAFYIMFLWLVLFIALIPERKVSLIFLVSMTYATCLYLMLLRALPNSFLLHKIVDKRVVLSHLVVATAIELVLTGAAVHLCVTVAATSPVILGHAVLWRRKEELFATEEEAIIAPAADADADAASGEMAPLILHDKVDDTQSLDVVV